MRAGAPNAGKYMALLGLEHGRSQTARHRPAPAVRTQPLDREQTCELQDFLLRLDRESRCRRFGHAASDEIMAAHAMTALEDATCVIGVFVDDVVRGVLEIYSCAPKGAPEVALVVDRDWRRRGLGWALLRAAVASEAQGIRLIFTRDNWPMRRLACKANARFDLVLDEICAEITLARLHA
jgi:GNAT superfamily N-acetyltransferase